MTRRHAALALAALSIICFAVPTFAQEGPMGPPRGGSPGMGRGHGGPGGPGGGPEQIGFALRALELMSEQTAQVATLLDARRELAESTRDADMTAHRALHEQITATAFDEAAIRAKAAVVSGLEADRMVADAKLLSDIRAILTDSQRAKFNSLLAPPEPPAGASGNARRR